MYYKRYILFFFTLSFLLFLLVNYDRNRLSKFGLDLAGFDDRLESFSDDKLVETNHRLFEEEIVILSEVNTENNKESKFTLVKEVTSDFSVNLSSEKEKTVVTHSFKFPFRLNPSGFRLLMKIRIESTFYPITIIFVGRDLKRLINIVIESCRAYIFSENRKGGYFYDSSPLLFPVKDTNYIELVMDWFNETYTISTLNNGHQTALGNNVRVNSPLVTAGFAFIGKEFRPITIGWVFENDPFISDFSCEISYYEERCKSYSIVILENKHKHFNGININEGFLKVAFQYPPKYKLPVKLNIGKKIVVEFDYEKLTVKSRNKPSKTHFFFDKYEEGEWINLDLVPISIDLINSLNSTMKNNMNTQEYNINISANSSHCLKEVLGNINRYNRIIFKNNYSVLNKKMNETSIEDKYGKPNPYKLLFAIDNEIIGNITINSGVFNRLYFTSNSSNTKLSGPLAYWRLKAGTPNYIDDNFVSSTKNL
ncbi:hypothetical protein FG379_000373 [Cryptosporidium bovis]|uniref:uncharacterized protein n=1 Tax=Cryptosporidium bovis TaxID=310047 RepID=UPI00351A1267|nr:hypothetical protein FG379_000373 [Cryptosporidium bovis]